MIDPRLRTIYDHYGWQHQIGKLKEECLELVEAVETFQSTLNAFDWAHVEEEMADVQNVLEQFQLRGFARMRIEEIREMKLERQLARIAKEKEAEK